MPESTQTRPAPRFSIVSAVYDVEPYLADFISSVEAQTFPLDRVEVVMVNDGATDGSPQILAEWQARRPDLVTVVDKPNGGTADARNAGLAVARGEWLTFTDPDDYLAPSYLSEIDAALRRHPGVAMAAARRIVVFDATQEQRPHGTDHLFAEVTRVRNLDEHPDFFSGHAPSTFVRGEVLRRTGLRFSTQVRPNWEDGHFSVSYLLRAERPVVAFVTPAEYFYRKRADASSLLSVSHGDRGRYTTVLEHGYLDALQQAQEKYGRVPDWLQSYILYELSWYFSMEEDPASAGRTVSDETARQMYPLMQRILRLIDRERIESYRDRTFPNVWRDVLLHGYDDAAWHSPYVLVDRLDTDQQLVRVRYRFAGACPREELYSEGRRVEAAFVKTRSVNYFGRTLLHERILWVPSGAVRVRLAGQDIEVLTEEPKPRRFNLRLWEIRDKYVPRQAVAADRRRPEGPPPPTLEERLTLRLARTGLVGRWFAKAWVLIDQVDNADDSAELLFRWLRRHKRSVNAWFVIEKGTADERRLRRDGYRRIVPYGSLRWKLLMLNAQHLISSQADPPVVRPQQLARMMPRPAWHHTFLNPGLHEDGSTPSLNRLEADLFLTSTSSEYESVAGDGSPYRYSSRETVLTGMPRLDALLAAGKRFAPEKRDLVVLAPDWRGIDHEGFMHGDSALGWLALLRAPEIEELADRHGLRVAMLLPASLQPIRDQLDVPAHVALLRGEGSAGRETLARARVVVTDRSSTASDAAYIERPVVYVDLGRRSGHDQHRYGPVAESYDEAVQVIVKTVDHGPHPQDEYLERIHSAFPKRDGRSTRRTFRAIARTTQRVPRQRSGGDPQTVDRSRPSQ